MGYCLAGTGFVPKLRVEFWLWFRIQGFRVWATSRGSRFRVQGLGFRVRTRKGDGKQ